MEAQQGLRERQHIIFECSTLDDLLAAYVRLKGLGIEPVHSVHHGAGATFYYEDPDQNVVELTLDLTNSQHSEGERTPGTPRRTCRSVRMWIRKR